MIASDCSRRQLLLSAAVPLLVAGKSTAPQLRFPTQARQRLAVTSYPFRTLIDSPTNKARDTSKPGMDLKEFATMVAKRFNVHNINPLGDHLASTEPGYLDDFRKAVAAAESHVVDLGLGARDFSDKTTNVRDEAIAYGRKWIDIALAVGSPSVRQHLRSAKGAAPSVEQTAASLGKLAEYGAKQNVVVNLENDSPGSEDPFFIVAVVSKVNHPYLRALPDFGNSIRGHDAAYNRKAVNAMFEHAFNMSHVKDKLVEKDGHADTVDVAEMFALARANSYRGYFSMEFDTAAGDPFQGTQELIEQSMKYM